MLNDLKKLGRKRFSAAAMVTALHKKYKRKYSRGYIGHVLSVKLGIRLREERNASTPHGKEELNQLIAPVIPIRKSRKVA